MRKIGLIIAAGVLIAGCSYKSTESDNRAGDRSGYTMNEPAGGSTKSNNASGSTYSGQRGGAVEPVGGESGSRSPGPIEKTQPQSNSTSKP